MGTSSQTRSVTPLHRSPLAQPATVPQVFRAAARILAANGLHRGDFIPDAFDREMDVPHHLRPMSIVAALKCATTGDPHLPSLLSDEAIGTLALRLTVDGEGPVFGGIFDLEAHVDSWGDAEGRTAEDAVAMLEAVAVALMVRAEDVEEQALAAVDARMVAEFGPVMAEWSPQQRDRYFGELAAVHAEFAPQGVAA
ncbi:hypothetical protein [Streptomyces sp. SID4982]|uniref:DUF6197 family protein n=1 Tax=Streptomyces sp. SID4982 TaxID=2690291 RepID=UPI00136D4925|nr:hypothetical protein [Streptomyces sp. SID4982]MYS15072.1 hypothetical protein [Streptomyces sp. SID4982]